MLVATIVLGLFGAVEFIKSLVPATSYEKMIAGYDKVEGEIIQWVVYEVEATGHFAFADGITYRGEPVVQYMVNDQEYTITSKVVFPKSFNKSTIDVFYDPLEPSKGEVLEYFKEKQKKAESQKSSDLITGIFLMILCFVCYKLYQNLDQGEEKKEKKGISVNMG